MTTENPSMNVVALDSVALAAMLDADSSTPPNTLPANVVNMGEEDPEEDDAADADAESTPTQIEVWSKSCFQCDAFNPSGKYSGPDSECHFSKGNGNCPGAMYTVTVMGPKLKALAHLQRCANEHGRKSPIFLRFLADKLDALASDADRDWVTENLGL